MTLRSNTTTNISGVARVSDNIQMSSFVSVANVQNVHIYLCDHPWKEVPGSKLRNESVPLRKSKNAWKYAPNQWKPRISVGIVPVITVSNDLESPSKIINYMRAVWTRTETLSVAL